MGLQKYYKASDETIKQQLARNEDGEAEDPNPELTRALTIIEHLRKQNAELKARNTTPPRGGIESQTAWLEKKLAAAYDAVRGVPTLDPKTILTVYKNHGHFLLRFPAGQLLPCYDPQQALKYLTKTHTLKALPEAWICVDNKGHIVLAQDTKGPETTTHLRGGNQTPKKQKP
jgi:hypothetical protein